MRISVSDARALAAALTSGADEADKAGQPDFDLLQAAASMDDAARQELTDALNSRQSGG